MSPELHDALCDALNADHLQLLYYCEIRWLSKGRVFNRFFELRYEVFTFLNDQRSPLAEHYIDQCFCTKLACLANVFDQLNAPNLSIQGRNSILFLVADKIEEFKKKIGLWKKELTASSFRCFYFSMKPSSHLL